MRRWRRSRVVLVGVVGLALLVSLLWPVSCVAWMGAHWSGRGNWAVGLILSPGRVELYHESPKSWVPQGLMTSGRVSHISTWPGRLKTAMGSWDDWSLERGEILRSLTVPLLPLEAVSLPVLVWGVWRLRKDRRAAGRVQRGECVACGYDLRGSPGRCPECGSVGGGAESQEGPTPSTVQPPPL